jgi:hypothetical protein
MVGTAPSARRANRRSIDIRSGAMVGSASITVAICFLGARVRLAQGDAKGAWFAAVAALA